MYLTYSSGNNVGNSHFVWHISPEISIEESFQSSLSTLESIKAEFPQFHTRAMRKALFEKFGRVCTGIKPAILRYFYRDLTGDSSASHDYQEAEIDERVREIINMEPEDPNTVIDLREVKKNGTRTKFECFWEKARTYLNEEMGTAVDDRRHGEIVHLTKAISIRDFREQVAQRCPMSVPSEEWLRLQFWPKTPKAKVTIHYTGRLNVRFMIQNDNFGSAMKMNIMRLQYFVTCVNML